MRWAGSGLYQPIVAGNCYPVGMPRVAVLGLRFSDGTLGWRGRCGWPSVAGVMDEKLVVEYEAQVVWSPTSWLNLKENNLVVATVVGADNGDGEGGEDSAAESIW